ncbi:MAG: ice-binding family protein [Bryobacteraceae bacterium]
MLLTFTLYSSSVARGSTLFGVQNEAILAASAVTSTGQTLIIGDLGLWPGTAITGFPPGIVQGTVNAGDAVAQQAQAYASGAYTTLAGLAFTTDLTGVDLGGLTLTPGIYHFDTSAQLTGLLTLDAQGNNDALFVFQIGSTLTTASASNVQVINGTSSTGLYWQVGSSATLGTTTNFAGNILALASITLNTGANILCGRAMALTGAVTLDTNIVSNDCNVSNEGSGRTDFGSYGFSGEFAETPEPATFSLMGASLMGFVILGWKRSRRARTILA